MRLDFGHDVEVATWVALHIPHMNGDDFGPCVAIGVVDNAGQPVAGVVFSNYRPAYKSIEVSCAAESARWLTRKLAGLIMAYPFSILGVNRVSATTLATPTSASRFLSRFGFQREGVIRRGLGDEDAAIWGLTSEDWARSPFNGDRVSVQAESGRPHTRRSRRARQRARKREHRDGAGATAPEHGEHDRPVRIG